MRSPNGTPKTIYSLWLQGRDRAPEIVECNFELWSRLNPGYRLQVLDSSDVERLLAGFPIPLELLTPQALSDVVRARILHESGGIWTDASVLPVRPLDDWLPDLTSTGGLFAFRCPAPDRLLSSWFLASSANQPVMELWWGEIERFWSIPRQRATFEGTAIPENPVASVSPEVSAESDFCPYFWFHYLFEYVVTTNEGARRLWDRCPEASAVPAHELQQLFSINPRPKRAEVLSVARRAPVHKLNWRHPYPMDLLKSIGESRPLFGLRW
jgi:capsular polysaccharide synthesis protein